MLSDLFLVISLGVQILTLVTLTITLFRMFRSAQEAQEARIVLAATTERTEASARLAATHAAETSLVAAGMAADIKEVATNTNSIVAAALAAKDVSAAAQVSAADAAGERRGIGIGIAQEVAKNTGE